MAINAPKCAVNMEQRLAALRRDQEIDGLRVYLIKYNLFPRNRDPQNSPIRIEELKELVKHWKLHRQRGFWRDHPDKDDLVRALLQHIRSEAASKKRRQEAQERYRKKSLAAGSDDAAAAKLRDFTMIFGSGGNGAGNSISGPAGLDSSCDVDSSSSEKGDSALAARKKRPTKSGGDLFYQRGDYDEGMIYLSRIDRSKFRTEERNPRTELLTTYASAPMPLDQLVRMGNNGGNNNDTKDKPSTAPPLLLYHALDLSSSSNTNTTTLAREMKLKSVEGLYSISCHRGTELQLIREGALATILGVLKMDDIAIRLFAAATLLNLTATAPPAATHRSSNGNLAVLSLAGKEVYAKLMDEGVVAALLELAHTPNATVKALCARALFRFTVDEAHHFRMVHEGSVVALTQLMASTPNDDVREACMNGLVNLAAIPRAVTCDSILTTLVALARTGKPALLVACSRALLNLSILPTTRSAIVEDGAIVALSVLVGYKQVALFGTISRVLCNLAAVKTNQELLVKNGALPIVADLLDNVHMAFERVAEGDEDADDTAKSAPVRTRTSTGTDTTTAVSTDSTSTSDIGINSTTLSLSAQRSSATTSSPTVAMDREAAVEAATELLTRVRKNCVNVLAHLCCNAKLQVRVANAGFVPRLLRVLTVDYTACRRLDDDTEKFCVLALANLALDDRCRPVVVQDGSVPVLLRLLQDSERTDASALLLKLDCVTALSNLMLHPKNFTRMVDEGVVPAFLAAINDSASPAIQRACVYAMLTLARDAGMKTRLADATGDRDTGAIPTMLAFASKSARDAELCGVSVSFLHHLATRAENHNVLYFEGAVGLLVRVLQRPSASEPAAVIYALWLDCMLTLASLANHVEKRASLIGDGVIEAIQHFLRVSASDTRQRDVRTETKLVRTQFAAAQILYKLEALCCAPATDVPAFLASLLLLAMQTAHKRSHRTTKAVAIQQRTVTRIALTVARMSLTSRGLRLLATVVDLPPALNTVMRTGLHEAQVCAAIALCNLATERGPLVGQHQHHHKSQKQLWRDATVDDLIVITLLRVNSEQTKAICAKALFNLLTHDDDDTDTNDADKRNTAVQTGILYALLKLARLENDEIRDLALRALYNLSLTTTSVAALLENEIVRVLVKLYQPECSSDVKRLLSGILRNLSRCVGLRDGRETNSNYAHRMLHEGALAILKSVAKARDPETKALAAHVLYHLSCTGDDDVASALVRDDANVLALLVAELKSENRDVRRFGAATLANLSASSSAVTVLADDTTLASVLNDTMQRALASACSSTTASCVVALRNLCVSSVATQRRVVNCNGVPTLAAILASDAMANDPQTRGLATDVLCALAHLDNGSSDSSSDTLEARLVRDGIVRALLAIVRGADAASLTRHATATDERTMAMPIITALSHLSKTAASHDAMLRDGALDIVSTLGKTNASDTRTPYKGLVGVRGEAFCYHCAVVLRNLSRPDSGTVVDKQLASGSVLLAVSRSSDAESSSASTPHATTSATADVKSQRIGAHAGLVPLVLALAQTTQPETREHVVVTLYNLALNRRCRAQLLKHDGVKTLLRLGTTATTAMKRHVCALALQALAKQDPVADDPHVANVVQDGIVAAIAALAEQHQHDVLAGAASFVSAVVAARTDAIATVGPAAVGSDLDYGISTSPSAIEALIRPETVLSPQQGAPPDWARVVIGSFAPWPEIEALVALADRRHEHHRPHSRQLQHQQHSSLNSQQRTLDNSAMVSVDGNIDDSDDSYSDASDSDDHTARSTRAASKDAAAAGPGGRTPVMTATSVPRSAVASPTIGVHVAVTTNATTSATTARVAMPRMCNAEVVLGALETLVDPAMEKVKVNVDAELALRRSVGSGSVGSGSSGSAGGSSGDSELPQLRPTTAPDSIIAAAGAEGIDGKPRKRSTLTSVRHDVLSSSTAGRSSMSGANVSVGHYEHQHQHHLQLQQPHQQSRASLTSPSPSPLRSPAVTPKRRSRTLEPLATPPSSSFKSSML